jgi:hypothetical protein
MMQVAAGVAGSMGGSALVGTMTRTGLDQISTGITGSAVKTPTPDVNVSVPEFKSPSSATVSP